MKRWFLVAALAACGGKGDGGASSRDALIAAWKSAGLAPSAFAPAANSPVGKDCATGTVNNVDVMVCNFANEADAKAATDAGLKWVGDTTGISQAKGSLLIAAADRKKADPTGATINKLMKAAP
ncbi:MAG: hypothetical protein QM831_23190 [Kofleriaceae bacterium]